MKKITLVLLLLCKLSLLSAAEEETRCLIEIADRVIAMIQGEQRWFNDALQSKIDGQKIPYPQNVPPVVQEYLDGELSRENTSFGHSYNSVVIDFLKSCFQEEGEQTFWNSQENPENTKTQIALWFYKRRFSALEEFERDVARLGSFETFLGETNCNRLFQERIENIELPSLTAQLQSLENNISERCATEQVRQVLDPSIFPLLEQEDALKREIYDLSGSIGMYYRKVHAPAATRKTPADYKARLTGSRIQELAAALKRDRECRQKLFEIETSRAISTWEARKRLLQAREDY